MKLRMILPFMAGLLAMLVLAACASSPVQSERDSEPLQVRETVEYRLGNGDELRVQVFGEPELSGPYTVDGTGAISMGLIGSVNVAGMTIPEFQSEIERQLGAGYLINPQVSAEVTSFRPYFILGEVNRPDQYQYSSGLTVLNAVAAAGGFTYRANERTVFITSQGANEEREVALTPTTPIRPGDRIRIGERIF